MKCKQNNKLSNGTARISVAFLLITFQTITCLLFLSVTECQLYSLYN